MLGLLKERIKSSLIVPKLIFLLTVFLGIMCIVLAVMFITVDAQTIIIEASYFTESINESLGMNDEIEVTLNP